MKNVMNLDLLFYPKSVAVIGASDNLGGGKLPYFQILQANGFAGALYPVKLAVNGQVPVYHFGRYGGMIPSPNEVVDAIKTNFLGGEIS